MQNLSFIKPPQAVKAVEEPAKTNAIASKTDQNNSYASDDSGAQNSFQNILNKQVLAKRAQENLSAKSTNKPASKSENTQQNQKVDETELDDDSVEGVQHANIDELIAKLKEHQLSDEDGSLEAEELDADKNQEILSALADSANQLQPQSYIDQALLRAQLQPNQASGTAQNVDAEEASIALDSQANATTNLENALFQNRTFTLQSESAAFDANRFKNTLSEKSGATSTEQGFSSDDKSTEDAHALLSDAAFGKNNAALESALKFLETEEAKDFFANSALSKDSSAKESFGKEFSQDTAHLNALQNQVASQSLLNPSTQAASSLAASNQIMAYPGRTGWNQEISQKVVWMVGAGEQSATLTLNPPDLGPLQVVISVNNDQADASFFSDNPEVRQALEDGLEYLRESMQSSGLQLGEANINAGQQSQQSFEEMAQRQSTNMPKAASNIIDTVLPSSGITVRESQGLVDTFA
jgi:flagellar hook-length control protein FliK